MRAASWSSLRPFRVLPSLLFAFGLIATSDLGFAAGAAASRPAPLPRSKAAGLPGGPTGGALPPGWADADIGSPAIPGSATFASGTFTVNASGTDIENTADQFHYVYQQVAGDVTVIARVASIQNTDPWAKGGVMIRETLAANARNASMLLTSGHGLTFQRRTVTGGATDTTDGRWIGTPYWVRITRTGNTFFGYSSPDGTTWTLVGSVTIALPTNAYVGLAVTSHSNGVGGSDVFDNVSVAGASNSAPTAAITSPANGTVFTPPANITINATASDSDGTVTKVDFYNGATLIGTDTTSPYSFAWNNVTSGIYSLTAVATDNGGATGTSAPVSITVNAKPTVSITSPANNAQFTSPANITINATASDSDGTVSKVDFYQNGILLGTDTTSPYSFAWNSVGAGSYTLTAIATDNLGGATTSAPIAIVVNPGNNPPSVSITSPANNAQFTAPANVTINATASDTDGTVTKVDFYQNGVLLGTDTTSPYSFAWNGVAAGNYALTAIATDNGGATKTSATVNIVVNPAGGGLPAPWVDQDIGSPGVAGSASYSAGVFTIKGGGADIEGTSDQFHYVYQSMSGTSITIIARVSGIQGTDAWAKAGVMIRESLAANSRHAMMVLTSGNGLAFQRRTTTGGITDSTGGSWVFAPYWVKLTRTNNTFTGYGSPDGVTWTTVGTVDIAMANSVFVGMPVTSHNNAVVGTDTFDNVSASGATNQLPTVSITSPANNATFTAPANITINATASDPDGTVTKVDFYQNGNLLGTDTTSPYSFAWNSVGTGSYALTAVATDNVGATKTSATVNITVTNNLPSVSITAPANGAVFNAPANITINATATDTDGTITKVDFYQNGSLLGTDTTSPYSFAWNNVGAGSYALTAVATDNAGGTKTSAAVNITVNGVVNNPPSVSITAPANGATFTAPANITINATASDSDGTVTKVDFYQNGVLLGTDTTSPYSFAWNSVAVGNYALTAIATDNSSATTTSATVNIVVNPAGGGLPAPWVDQDIGSPGLPGTASYSGGVFTVTGGGADIEGASDQFHYVYQPITAANITIIARVSAIQGTDPWAKGGVMIRETLTANSRHAFMTLTSGNGVLLQRRTATGGDTTSTSGRWVFAPYWVKLVRAGTLLTGYASSDGVNWDVVGSATVSMTNSVFVGLPVTSHNNGVVGTDTFDSVTVTSP
jgi:hypothetical protein